MARSSARCSLCQNPLFGGKNELAGGTFTKDSNRCTPVPATIHAPISAVASVIIPLTACGSANSSLIRYLEDDLQRILGTVLDSRPTAPVLAPVVATGPYYESLCERLLKKRFPDMYWSKTHIECYNFFQQCKDHFATSGATWPNRVPLAAIFLKDAILFRWQQHQRKVEDKTNVLTT